ncbi:MAG: SPFH domain-containing protein [Chloroflexota bacterium]|nr:SPFH domain-containing protein [Chloroflexota bacterium]
MDETPLHKRPWFYIAGWLALLLFVYGWQISRMGGIRANLLEIFFDLACVFPLLLLLWMAFFAQFVLPVRTFGDRRRIFNRLISYLFGSHGPALFIENGQIKEHHGERLKKGPGVLWLDSASAAVTRTAVSIRQTVGPGVHFTDSFEYIAGTVDLHNQSLVIGPKESDRPFEEKKEDQLQEEWDQVQDRRKQVSALTRDGIEVIPNISVSFRVKTGFPKEGQPGSRFGYRTGVRRSDKLKEREDQEAIQRAILGEGINPTAVLDSPRRRVAWNELPGSLAVDVWREYAAKFTLDQLFLPEQLVPPAPPPVPRPTEEEIDPLSQPIQVGGNRDTMRTNVARMVREMNIMMSRTIGALEGKGNGRNKRTVVPPPFTTDTRAKLAPEKKTALQVINEMVKARLTQSEVDVLDDHGVRGEGKVESMEYKLLQERGIEVLSVGIGNLRFNKTIEETIISRWSTTWVTNAKLESEQVERRRNLVETAGHEQAIRQYADFLSKDLMQKRPVGIKETLKTMLLRTRTLIMNNPQLRQRMTEEQQDLEDIIRWIEGSGT